MGEISFWHILLLLVVILLFWGPSRLPGFGMSLGKAIKNFKTGLKGLESSEKDSEVK